MLPDPCRAGPCSRAGGVDVEESLGGGEHAETDGRGQGVALLDGGPRYRTHGGERVGPAHEAPQAPRKVSGPSLGEESVPHHRLQYSDCTAVWTLRIL